MCSHHDAIQLEPPEGGSPPSQRSAALAACEDRCAGHASAPIDDSVSILSGSTCFTRAEAKNCGAWVRKSWHRTAPTSLPFLLYFSPNTSVPLELLVQLGCAIATASAPSMLGAICLIRRGRGRRRASAATARCQVERRCSEAIFSC